MLIYILSFSKDFKIDGKIFYNPIGLIYTWLVEQLYRRAFLLQIELPFQIEVYPISDSKSSSPRLGIIVALNHRVIANFFFQRVIHTDLCNPRVPTDTEDFQRRVHHELL